jgi:hypothetical protein
MRSYWRLPESLQAAAYVAEGEYAWPRDKALLVIQDVGERGCAVIGIEVWLATEPGPTIPTPGIYAWDGESQHPGEPWPVFVQRVNAAAACYVRTFSWHPDDEQHILEVPYFNLVVVEEREDPKDE